MEDLMKLAQVSIALSVAFVWIFRYHNVITEFKSFGLSDLTRNFVGVSKIALSTLLVTGVYVEPPLVFVSSVLMGFFMVSAQFFHFKIKNTFIKHLPSLVLLILCGFIAYSSMP